MTADPAKPTCRIGMVWGGADARRQEAARAAIASDSAQVVGGLIGVHGREG